MRAGSGHLPNFDSWVDKVMDWKVKYDPFGYFNSSNNVTYSSKLDNHLVLPCRYF